MQLIDQEHQERHHIRLSMNCCRLFFRRKPWPGPSSIAGREWVDLAVGIVYGQRLVTSKQDLGAHARKTFLQDTLNTGWNTQSTREQWDAKFNKLWSGWLHPRSRLVLWCIIQNGYFCSVKGLQWKKSDGMCPFCLHSHHGDDSSPLPRLQGSASKMEPGG